MADLDGWMANYGEHLLAEATYDVAKPGRWWRDSLWLRMLTNAPTKRLACGDGHILAVICGVLSRVECGWTGWLIVSPDQVHDHADEHK